MAISRLFFEIGGDAKALNESLKQAIENAKQTGVEVTRAGRTIISRFDEALNPTKNLKEQIELLSRSGKSAADIQKLLGDQIHEASKKAREMGQPIDDLVKKYHTFDRQLKDVGETMRNVGADMTRYITVPLAAAGALVVKAADDYDKGIAKIRIGTGATGDALKKLTDDMSAVWGTIPQGAEQIGSAIADLNTRLGLAGKPLQDMATQMLNLARITGGELTQTIAGATRLFVDWSVSTADQSKKLDYLFRVSQTTGIQMQKLLEITVQYGAPMRALGFDLENAAGAMGKWEKEGVNMETVLAGLKYGLGQFAKAGADPIETMAAIQKAISGARTEADATSIALKAFGQRAAVDLSKAIQEGRFDLVEFVKAAREGSDTINDAADSSKTLGDRMLQLKERTEKALVPIGEKLVDVLETSLLPILDKIIDKVAAAADWFSKLDPFWQKTIIGVGGVTTVAGPAISGIGNLAVAAASLSIALGGGGGAGLVARLGSGAAALGRFGLVAGGIAAALYAAKEGLEWLGKTDFMRGKIGSGPKTDWTDETRAIVEQTKALYEQARAIGVVDDEYQKNLEYVKKMGMQDQVKLQDPLEKLTGESWETYYVRLKNIVDEWTAAHPVLDQLTGDLGKMGTATGAAGGGLGALDDELKKLVETLHNSARPADALATEMERLEKANAPMDEIMAAYSERLVEAAEKQKMLGFALSETTKQYMGQALQIKTQMDWEKANQEALQMIEESNKKLAQDAQERADKALRDAQAAKDISEKINAVIVQGKKEELQLQVRLLEATTPRTQREAERIAQEKAALEYRLAAEEISVKFEQQRLEILDAINKLDLGSDAYKNAQAALEQLEIEKQKALERLNQTRTVDLADQQKSQFETIYNTLEERAAGVWDAITGRGKGAFTSLADWVEGIFLTRLKQIFTNLVAQLGTGSFNIGGLLGLGGSAAGGGAAAGGWGNVLGGGLLGPGTVIPAGIAAVMSNNPYAKALGGLGLGVAGMAGLSTLALGGGMGVFSSMLGAAFTNPITGILAGGLLGGIALADWASGPNSMKAASKEIKRDFGGIAFSDKNVEAYYKSLGITEPQAWDYRAQLNRTPVMVQQLALAAQQQGKLDDFLKSLEASSRATGSGGWGQNIRPSVEIGLATGDWSELNEWFKWLMQDKAFGSLKDILPEWQELALIDAGTKSLKDSFVELRAAIKDSIQPVDEMFNTFLETGKITDDFREKILAFGGDLGRFENLSNIMTLNQYFNEMADHFRQTGELLPDLVRLIEQYGGSMAGIDTGRLNTLTASLGTIGNLTSGLGSLKQRFDPINRLLQGEFDASVQAALAAAGLDASKFSNVAQMINTQNNWGTLTQNALQGGALSSDLLAMLSKFGGEAGAQAVARYGQGFNTVTSDLLESTKLAMDQAFNEEITSAMDYLAEIQQETKSEIENLTAAVEAQLTIAGDNIGQAVNDAKEAVVQALNDIILAIYYQDNPEAIASAWPDIVAGRASSAAAQQPAAIQTPAATGETGAAAEISNQAAAAAAAILNINIESVYGNSDLMTTILSALAQAQARGIQIIGTQTLATT